MTWQKQLKWADILLLQASFSRKDQVKDAMIASGFTIEETIIMEDWVAFIAKRG